MCIREAISPLQAQVQQLNESTDDLIITYFNQIYTQREILAALSTFHGILLPLRTLQRALRRLGLRRQRVMNADVLQRARVAIIEENGSSGQLLGYKAMWKRLQRRRIPVTRRQVGILMVQCDPQGVRIRRICRLKRRKYVSPGPNFVWHIDGYDKLKPYGYPIHGAIDGYSRRVLWLEVGVTNNNPFVVLKHFVDTVSSYRHCHVLFEVITEPKIVRFVIF